MGGGEEGEEEEEKRGEEENVVKACPFIRAERDLGEESFSNLGRKKRINYVTHNIRKGSPGFRAGNWP